MSKDKKTVIVVGAGASVGLEMAVLDKLAEADMNTHCVSSATELEELGIEHTGSEIEIKAVDYDETRIATVIDEPSGIGKPRSKKRKRWHR